MTEHAGTLRSAIVALTAVVLVVGCGSGATQNSSTTATTSVPPRSSSTTANVDLRGTYLSIMEPFEKELRLFVCDIHKKQFDPNVSDAGALRWNRLWAT